jgi:DNA-binding transcriptional LysR family regulator
MRREELGDLVAFLAVADELSFTKAAAKLGTSQSALSHTVRRLEERLGIRLLTRTTRSLSPTQAGAQLIAALRPALEEIDARIASLSALREKPAGTIRINTSRHAAETILWPTIEQLLPDYPDIRFELALDQALTDIVAEGFDAGVRLGERVEKDMIAVRISPDLRMAVVGSPSYVAVRGRPETPHDLTKHACINMRLQTRGGLYAWEFEKDGRALNVRVDGPLVFNDSPLIITAALAGAGLAFVLEVQANRALDEGRLVRVLDDWCPAFSGYHLYYPSRRQPSPAFNVLVNALRVRA